MSGDGGMQQQQSLLHSQTHMVRSCSSFPCGMCFQLRGGELTGPSLREEEGGNGQLSSFSRVQSRTTRSWRGAPRKRLTGCGQQASGFPARTDFWSLFAWYERVALFRRFVKKQSVSFLESKEVYNSTMCKTRHKANKQASAAGSRADTRVAMATTCSAWAALSRFSAPLPRCHLLFLLVGCFSGGDCFGF